MWCLGLALYGACWFAAVSRREGLWQMAELVDVAAFPVTMWIVFFGDVSFGWWWLAVGPAVAFFAALVALCAHWCWAEIRHWPEFDAGGANP